MPRIHSHHLKVGYCFMIRMRPIYGKGTDINFRFCPSVRNSSISLFGIQARTWQLIEVFNWLEEILKIQRMHGKDEIEVCCEGVVIGGLHMEVQQ